MKKESKRKKIQKHWDNLYENFINKENVKNIL